MEKKAGGDVVLIPIECVCLSACASEIMTYLNGKTFEIALFYGTTREFKSSYKIFNGILGGGFFYFAVVLPYIEWMTI